MYDSIMNFINGHSENMVALQALLIGVGGALMWGLSKAVMLLKYPIALISKFTTVTLELDGGSWDSIYGYDRFMGWVDTQKLLFRNRVRPNYNYTPKSSHLITPTSSGSGTCIMWYKGRIFIISTTIYIKEFGCYGVTRIVMFGRNINRIQEMLVDSWGYNELKLNIMVSNEGNWCVSNSATPRTFDTIAMDQKVRKSLIDSVDLFTSREKSYEKKGITWKNNICLYGPPGTGKTSIVKAIATKYNLDLYTIDTTNGTDADFIRAVSKIPVEGILILEDIDSNKNFKPRKIGEEDTDEHLVKNNKNKISTTKGVSLQSLLNVLDGIYTPHGLKCVITTNHIDKLDPAIIRLGRIDSTIEVGYLDPDSVSTYINGVYGINVTLSHNDPNFRISGATLSSFVIKYFDDYKKVIENLCSIGYRVG